MCQNVSRYIIIKIFSVFHNKYLWKHVLKIKNSQWIWISLHLSAVSQEKAKKGLKLLLATKVAMIILFIRLKQKYFAFTLSCWLPYKYCLQKSFGKCLPFKVISENSVCRSWMVPNCQSAKYFFFKRVEKESALTRWGRQRDMILAKEGSCWVVNKIQHQP